MNLLADSAGWRAAFQEVEDTYRRKGVEPGGPGGVPMTREASPGATFQLWVSDGAAGRSWHQDLFGREPDFRPSPRPQDKGSS
jgi:hypothetical protein